VIVVDASAVVEVLLRLEKSNVLIERLLGSDEKLCAPELLDVEVAQVIRRYWRSGDVTAARGTAAINDLTDLPIERFAHAPLLDRIWQLRSNATAYDAAYIALAEATDSPLVTCDKALKSIPGTRAVVEVF
jgi:predicted nucleic acid-binding protein